MGPIYFEATADNKGRLEVPKKFKQWFDEPVTMRFDETTGVLYVTKDLNGEKLDGRRRIALNRFENTLVEVRKIKGALQIKKKTGRY
ncbi:MAG: hypothetical protein FWE27_04865 [Defluviitaleaceae bacterium]|nr:hypothetical protein [Defluviitaleaceae bacterium]